MLSLASPARPWTCTWPSPCCACRAASTAARRWTRTCRPTSPTSTSRTWPLSHVSTPGLTYTCYTALVSNVFLVIWGIKPLFQPLRDWSFFFTGYLSNWVVVFLLFAFRWLNYLDQIKPVNCQLSDDSETSVIMLRVVLRNSKKMPRIHNTVEK